MLTRLDDRFVPRLPTGRHSAWIALVVAAALGLASVVVAGLEWGPTALADASPVYFGAIVLVGSLLGTWPAIATAVLAFVVYDLAFTEPRLTLVVDDPREWLDLVVFLVIAVVVGRLAALGTERATEASRRAAESTDLFAISRILATAPDVEDAAPPVIRRLVDAGSLERVWIVRERRAGAAAAHVVADTSPGDPLPVSTIVVSLVRTPGDAPARWVRAHEPGPSGAGGAGEVARRGGRPLVRVKMEADGVTVGALKATIPAALREPDRSTTRLLSLAADQLALAIRRDDLRREATEAEIARRADALKSALLDAVSHDLRTPLASIRAAAGSLADPDLAVEPDAVRSAAVAIDSEADRLDRLVREVLDLSRIEAGSLRPTLEPLVLGDAVAAVVERLRSSLGERPIRIAVPETLPPVRADAVLLDAILTNLVGNVASHTTAPAPLEVRAAATAGDGRIALTVDDGGPGLSETARARLFRKFESPVGVSAGSRPGLGLGLAIVRGMAEAMGGSVGAAASPLGGLRIELSLPAAAPAPDERSGADPGRVAAVRVAGPADTRRG